MREFFLNSCRPGIWVIALCEIAICCLLLKKYKEKKHPMLLCMAFIAMGLIVDALVIVNGAALGGALSILSRLRFVAHGVLIPLLLPICGYSLNAKKGLMKVLWVLTAVIMAAGAAEGFATVFEQFSIAGVTRLISSAATPSWANIITYVLSFGMVIPMLLCGIAAWIKQKNPCLFLAAFLMFAFSALGPATGNTDLIFYISMFGEVLMIFFLYLFAKKKLG